MASAHSRHQHRVLRQLGLAIFAARRDHRAAEAGEARQRLAQDRVDHRTVHGWRDQHAGRPGLQPPERAGQGGRDRVVGDAAAWVGCAKQIVAPNNDLAVCSGESSVRAWLQANAVWVDPATGSMYVVGSRGANGSNAATVNNPSRQVELLVRVKMK